MRLRRLALHWTIAWAFLWPGFGHALDSALDISQYGHTTWRNLDGFAAGTVGAMAQTPDGYLWLGTPSGVLRFDGVRSVAWQPPVGSALPDNRVRALLGARDGTLWIGTLRGLASWKDGTLVAHVPLQGKLINALAETEEGTIWVGGIGESAALLCAIAPGSTDCREVDGNFGPVIFSLFAEPGGAVWVGGRDTVWKWRAGSLVSHALPAPIGTLRTLTGAPDGRIAIGTQNGLFTVLDDRVQPLSIPSHDMQLRFNKVLYDRGGSLWMAPVESGLMHFHEGRLDAFNASDGLSSDQIYGLFEDREENMWVATRNGLDRFRPVAARTYSKTQGLRGRVVSVIAAREGSVLASTSAGLFRIEAGSVSEVPGPSRGGVLFQDSRSRVWIGSLRGVGYVDGNRFVHVHEVRGGYDAIAEDSNGHIWISQRDEGLMRVTPDGKISSIAWSEIGHASYASSIAADPARGGLWMGLWSGALVHFVDGKVRTSIDVGEGTQGRAINQVRVDRDGTVWVATDTGLSRVRDGRVSRLDTGSGMPCDSVTATLADDQSLWLHTGCGLVKVSLTDLEAWAGAAERGTKRSVQARLLDHWDGIRTDLFIGRIGQLAEMRHYSPRMARTPDGLIWLATNDGVSVVDPSRLPFNAIPPPVFIERVGADGTSHEPVASLRLPGIVKNLEIDYTGLSLTLPEKVRFRYKLEGRDVEWQDAGNRRRAFYTDLAPGNYRFQVIAANNSGVWNQAPATIALSIPPAYYQTVWFRALSTIVIVSTICAFYVLRLKGLERRFEMRTHERVAERTRIARALHDSLLQNFQGALLKFQAAALLLPGKPEAARYLLQDVIQQAEQAIVHGRDAVHGLRSSTVLTNALAADLLALGRGLDAPPPGMRPEFDVFVHGEPKELVPLVRDEVHHIALEALRNAFRHSGARQVHVHLHYETARLRVRICDDGKGVPHEVLTERGRPGHFGLLGMHERAELAGGVLAIKSAIPAGTEVSLAITGSRAYLRPQRKVKVQPA